MWKRKKRQVEKEKTEPDIRDIVPMVKISSIVVPKRMRTVPRKQEEEKIPPDLIEKYTLNMSEDSLEVNEIISNNA